MIEFLDLFFLKHCSAMLYISPLISLLLGIFFGGSVRHSYHTNVVTKGVKISVGLSLIFFNLCGLILFLESLFLAHHESRMYFIVIIQYILITFLSYNILARYIIYHEKVFIKHLTTICPTIVALLSLILLIFSKQPINNYVLIIFIIISIILIYKLLRKPAKYDDFKDGFISKEISYKVGFYDWVFTFKEVKADKYEVREDYLENRLKDLGPEVILFLLLDLILVVFTK